MYSGASRASARRLLVGVAVAAIAVTGTATSASAASVENGGFETGDLTGWTVVDQDASNGSWYAYSGTTSPLSGFDIVAPPEGVFGATSDQSGPGSHILYQDVFLEPASSHELSFSVYYNNLAGAFHTPDTLDFNVFPNQQYRIDVVDPSAPVDSVAPTDVLATVFRTEVGDPSTLAPTTITFDLTPYAGSTVRLRLAEVDNQLFLLAGVDDVRITTTPRTPTSVGACKAEGWRNFVNNAGQPFKNQGDCVSFVATGGRNR